MIARDSNFGDQQRGDGADRVDLLRGRHRQAMARAPCYFNQLMNQTMMRAFTKSIKNAPTIGTTMNARGLGPNLETSVRMFAMALATVPSTNPMNPLAMTAES